MGDDVGMWNISAYHRGMISGSTPNIDKIAADGLFADDGICASLLHGGTRSVHHRSASDPRRA